MADYTYGDTARVRVSFAMPDGAAVSATGVAIVARAPDGSTVTASPVFDLGHGAFYGEFACNVVGKWTVRATCTGPVACARERVFTVNDSPFAS